MHYVCHQRVSEIESYRYTKMIAAPLFIAMLVCVWIATHEGGYIRNRKGELVPDSKTVRFLAWVSGLFKR